MSSPSPAVPSFMDVRTVLLGIFLTLALAMLALLSPTTARADALLDAGAAVAAHKRGDLDEAIRLYTRALGSPDVEPASQASLLLNRGICFAALGQYERALRDYTEAMQTRPGYALAYYNRANAYRALDQLERALQDYDQAIRLNPRHAASYGNRAFVFQAQGRLDKARADVLTAKSLDPKVPVPQF